jgi:uncharacterized hydrophobic protein (TIGR00271 family)
MLHIRLITPPDVTDRLVAALSSKANIVNVVVAPGTALSPKGDAVQFEIRESSANLAFEQFHEFGIDRRGTISVEHVDATIPDPRGPHGPSNSDQHEIAPVWRLVEFQIRQGAVCPPSFYILLVIAGLIAAVGILTNSQILVVGAMVVGPEYGPIIGAALGINNRERPLIRQCLFALIVGFLAAVLLSLIFSLCIRWTGKAPPAYLLGIRPVSSLIDKPNLFSLVVAVAAGIVGVVSLTEARASTLIGVFISVTTIPAAADIGLSSAFGQWSEAWGSAVQLLLNVTVLIAVGSIALKVQGRIWRAAGRSPVISPGGDGID